MASIIRDNSAPLWRPDLYRIFTLLSLTQTPVRINTRFSRDGETFQAITLTGVITEVNGLECVYCVNSVEYPETEAFAAAPACDYSAILATNTSGTAQLVEYSGHARILNCRVDSHGLPEELHVHFSLPGRVRPLRRHPRQSCDKWDGVIAGLTLLDGELRSRQELLALMRHYYCKKNRVIPQLINISPGGVCLRTEDAIARRLMHGTDRYLFFFFLRSPLEEKVPWVFQGRKAGAFRVADSADNGLRIQFLQELCWESSPKYLSWKDVSAIGSENLQRVLQIMLKSGDKPDILSPYSVSALAGSGSPKH